MSVKELIKVNEGILVTHIKRCGLRLSGPLGHQAVCTEACKVGSVRLLLGSLVMNGNIT